MAKPPVKKKKAPAFKPAPMPMPAPQPGGMPAMPMPPMRGR